MPFYAGLRLGEAVALNVTDVQLSARKGTIIVRSGKGSRYREIPTHATLRDNLAVWIDDERPLWSGAQTNSALLLNRRGGRLSARAADQILGAIADDANIEEFTPHILRSFGTRLIPVKQLRSARVISTRTCVRPESPPGPLRTRSGCRSAATAPGDLCRTRSRHLNSTSTASSVSCLH